MTDLAWWGQLGDEDARAAMCSAENVARVRAVFDKLTPDPIWTPVVIAQLDAARLDLRLAMAWLASVIEPDLYLEVGVRRGFAAATVAALRPDAAIYGFDMWVRAYAGVTNPGPRFVREELARVGFRGVVTFVDGDSHVTLPRFFGERPYPRWDRLRGRAVAAPARQFDMVLVDGDHSIEGAYRDLSDVLGHIRVGGAIVFDDIAPDLSQFDAAGLRAIEEELGPDPCGLGGLLGVWRAIRDEHPEYRFFEFPQDAPGVAFAIRMR